jgi:uncharacterized protein YjbI with pentapeptide repeats
MQWSIVGALALGIGIGAAALWGAWWLWWRLPKRQADRLRLTIRDPKARADVEDNFRKTIGQLLGGAAVLIGAGLAYLQFSQQQQTAQLQFAQQQQAAHELLISNQVAKGFEQLGSDTVVVRLGGIYALEGVLNTSEQYHQPVLEALCAFVRDGTRNETGDAPATDIQAALTVIGRRVVIGTMVTNRVDLGGAHIPKVRLMGADLTIGDLSFANLSGANLNQAVLNTASLYAALLQGTHLSGANLTAAQLQEADLSRADLGFANLTGAHLNHTNLTGANLSHTNMSGAEASARLNHAILLLRGANLTDANLTGTELQEADLTGANLSHANLTGADLSGATVSQAQLDQACGTDVKLPPGLNLKPCPPPHQ